MKWIPQWLLLASPGLCTEYTEWLQCVFAEVRKDLVTARYRRLVLVEAAYSVSCDSQWCGFSLCLLFFLFIRHKPSRFSLHPNLPPHHIAKDVLVPFWSFNYTSTDSSCSIPGVFGETESWYFHLYTQKNLGWSLFCSYCLIMLFFLFLFCAPALIIVDPFPFVCFSFVTLSSSSLLQY